MVEVKFCGMTRAADAREAVALGARYVGVVFAGGPRRQSTAGAAAIFAGLPAGVGRVGVFGADTPAEIAARASSLGLFAVQLHGDPTPGDVAALRAAWNGEVWAAVRVANGALPPVAHDLFATADAVVLDARVEGALGGTGVALAWESLAASLAGVRRAGHARLVLAGGLRPGNVARAIRALRPEVVDVSSGVEGREVGSKDPDCMRAFRDAVASVEDRR